MPVSSNALGEGLRVVRFALCVAVLLLVSPSSWAQQVGDTPPAQADVAADESTATAEEPALGSQAETSQSNEASPLEGEAGREPDNQVSPAELGSVPARDALEAQKSERSEEGVAVDAEAPPTGSDELEATDESPDAATLEAVLLETAVRQADTRNYSLDIYGFADFTYQQGLQAGERGNFFIGRLNLYLAGQLAERWRSLAEVRFTYLPNGSQLPGQPERIDTTSADYADLGRPVPVGGVILERAWLEYAAHPLATLRVGQFLTPYGIWNVDHGSPVIIGSRRPFIIGERLFPEWQTGFQLYGTHHLARTELGYHLTLSNGRGPLDRYFDMDANKAYGGRVYANFDTDWGDVDVGVSAYKGKYTSTVGDGFSAPVTIEESFNEFSIAADLKWSVGGFLLQGEVISNDVRYTDEGRPPNGFGGFYPDHRRWGMYGLTGYRFDFVGLMPFVAFDFNDPGPTGLGVPAMAFWAGINARPIPRVVLKVQYTYAWYLSDIWSDSRYSTIDTQAAWSF